MFVDPDGNERVCNTLKALIEEYGAESITVYVPEGWRGKGANHGDLGSVSLQFHTCNSVAIKVRWDSVQLKYEELLT